MALTVSLTTFPRFSRHTSSQKRLQYTAVIFALYVQQWTQDWLNPSSPGPGHCPQQEVRYVSLCCRMKMMFSAREFRADAEADGGRGKQKLPALCHLTCLAATETARWKRSTPASLWPSHGEARTVYHCR